MHFLLGWDPVSGLATGVLCFVLGTAALLPTMSPADPGESTAAPSAVESVEPDTTPDSHGQAAASLTLVSPLEGATVTGLSVDVTGIADARIGPVRLAVLRGTAVLGSVELDLERRGPFETVISLGRAPLVGRVRLVLTQESPEGIVLLASREVWLCSTCV
jgi:hypothetical protein